MKWHGVLLPIFHGITYLLVGKLTDEQKAKVYCHAKEIAGVIAESAAKGVAEGIVDKSKK